MNSKKKRKLQKLGGRVTTVAEFFDLSEAEEAIIELRLELAAAVKKRRTAARMTQAALAKAIGSSQARVAKMGTRRRASSRLSVLWLCSEESQGSRWRDDPGQAFVR